MSSPSDKPLGEGEVQTCTFLNFAAFSPWLFAQEDKSPSVLTGDVFWHKNKLQLF